jgi:predicted peroxiredoxin
MRRPIGAVLALLATAAMAAPVGPNLFIAGDGFTIEQALGDAAAQRTAMDAPTYKVLVTGDQAQRVLASQASSDLRKLIHDARRHGARFYVCAKDLAALGVRPKDVLPGVRAVHGHLTSSSSAWEHKVPPAPDRKALAVCSA